MMNLPKVELMSYSSGDTDYYGASYVFAKYCGLKTRPYKASGLIQHGWAPDYWESNPLVALTSMHAGNKAQQFYVWRGETRMRLSEGFGYNEIYATGAPVIYLDEKEIQRTAGSLLVMPMHSLDYTNNSHWKFDEYAQKIEEIKHDFNVVRVCLHPSCFKNGYWIKEFEALGIEIVEGANIRDINALERMRILFSSHEYVTTNGLGTHIVYGQYFGAKVSIFGQYIEARKEDHVNTPYYLKYPTALEDIIEFRKEEVVRSHYPDLFVHPKQAKLKLKEGAYEVGESAKLSPAELRKVLGWQKSKVALHNMKKPFFRIGVAVSKILPESLRGKLKKNFLLES